MLRATCTQTLPSDLASRTAVARPVNILAYVHLRNIYASTGAGRVARQMVEHLAQREDTQVQVLADPADHERIVPLVGAPWNQFPYRFFRSETSRQQAQWIFLESPSAESYWPEADVVYCTAESYVPTKKARLAVTLHDAAYFEADAHNRDRAFSLQRLKWRLLYRKLDRRTDLFHTVSHFSAERLAHFFPRIASRLRVVPNAVTPFFFQPVACAELGALTALGLGTRPFILVPGGLHFRKNAELILEAWPLLKSIHPELVLAVVNHSNAAYQKRAEELGLDIKILGFVSDAMLRALYTAAAVVWFPSRYEGFGLPVLEAMACGAAVVTSRASSLPEIAGDAALLASPGRSHDHVDALAALLQDEALRRELGRKGQSHAAAFTWQTSAEKLRREFDALL